MFKSYKMQKAYLLNAENKDSSHNGKCTENNVGQPIVFRQVHWMLVKEGQKSHANKPSHACSYKHNISNEMRS